MGNAKRDNNYIPTLLAVSNVDGESPVVLYADPTTHRLLVSMLSDLDDLSDVTITSVSAGDILYRNAGNTAWVNLAIGSATNVLTVNAGATAPEWSAGGSSSDVKVAIDSSATADYIGAASSDGVLRTGTPISYTDGGDFITLDIATDGINNTHIDWGTGANQVSAVDVPIADAGSYFTGTEVETALQEIGTASADKNDPTGFITRTDSTISFTDGTRTFSIQPTGANFSYYEAGLKLTTTGDTLVIADTEGIHVIYYDGSTLTESVNPNNSSISTLIKTKTLVSILYWDTSGATAIYVGEERHCIQMSGATHNYEHFTNGCVYRSGLGLNTINADGTGVTADAQFGVDAGAVADEDIYNTISAVNSTTGLPIYYMLGASAEWQKHTEAGFSVRTFDGTSSTRLAWNEYTGGSWQLTEVTNNDFVLCHIFATTEKDNPMIAIMGQAVYTTRSKARTGAKTEIMSLILDDVLFPEIRPIATVIFQTNTSYDSDVNARIRTTEDGDDYIDWRSEQISRVSVSTDDHNSLSNLQGGTTDEYYHLTEAEHTIATQAADTTNSGYLTTTDWDTFNDKIDSSVATLSSLTSIGTIGTGVWNGTTIAIASGGTGATTLAGASIPTYTSTNTFTNKRITQRVGTTASSATPTPVGDSNDMFTVTALAANATFAAPSGTPTNGQKLMIRIKDNGTARTLAWNAIYRASSDLALPTTTVVSKTIYLGFAYNSADSKWDLLALLDNI